ncbi:MAG: hypothetical protein EOO71_15305 [Myxococcaceae bacterium]|nr:MAG: hypothetical protein EOO71_15305 [Myxococcaceae bacterium]
MTLGSLLPEIVVSDAVTGWFASSKHSSSLALADLEQTALRGELDDAFLQSEAWIGFTDRVRELWRKYDHVVLRGVPEVGEGVSLLLASLALSRRFKPYRKDKVVKHFRMSPWTTDLSHTLKEGHFHTDINTAPLPPVVTAIQCKVPDPASPSQGELRVARLYELLAELHRRNASAALTFLQETDVSMVNETSPGGWTGCCIAEGRIRFHPETLRAGQRRFGKNPIELEAHLQLIHDAALSVSTPIHLGAGDVLLVSNTRALHYRGACTVVFQSFPRAFTSREVYVLHMLDEPL